MLMSLSHEKMANLSLTGYGKSLQWHFSKEPRPVSWLPPGQRELQEETSFSPDVASLFIVSDTGVCGILWEGFKFFYYYSYYF